MTTPAQWDQDYWNLSGALINYRPEYSCCSGRKFYIISQKERVSLGDLEDRVLALLTEKKTFITKELKERSDSISLLKGWSGALLNEDLYRRQAENPFAENYFLSLSQQSLTKLKPLNDALTEAGFSQFKARLVDKIVDLDKNSDKDFYEGKEPPSPCFRIILFIRRLFGNLFRTAHSNFPSVFEKEKSKMGVDSLAKQIRICHAQLAIIWINRILKIRKLIGRAVDNNFPLRPHEVPMKDEMQKLEKLLMEGVFNQNSKLDFKNAFFGIKLTEEEKQHIGQKGDLFFGAVLTAADSNMHPPILPATQDQVLDRYNPFNETALANYTPEICAKMYVVAALQYSLFHSK